MDLLIAMSLKSRAGIFIQKLYATNDVINVICTILNILILFAYFLPTLFAYEQALFT